MIKTILKISVVTAAAVVSFFGVNFSQKKINVSGELANITLVSLGIQARAYCNEANQGQWDNGLCTGTVNDPSTRCLQPASSTSPTNCYR